MQDAGAQPRCSCGRLPVTPAARLQDIGDAKAVPHLEALASRELDGRVVRRAREAALRLREGRQRSDEMRRLREDIEKLQQDNRDLRDRLDRVEAQMTSQH